MFFSMPFPSQFLDVHGGLKQLCQLETQLPFGRSHQTFVDICGQVRTSDQFREMLGVVLKVPCQR